MTRAARPAAQREALRAARDRRVAAGTGEGHGLSIDRRGHAMSATARPASRVPGRLLVPGLPPAVGRGVPVQHRHLDPGRRAVLADPHPLGRPVLPRAAQLRAGGAAARVHAGRRRRGRPHRPPADPALVAALPDGHGGRCWAALASDRLGIVAIVVIALLTGLMQSQSAPDLPGGDHEPRAARADRQRGGPQLAAVQPLARDRAGDRRPAAGRRSARGPASRRTRSRSWP